MSSSEKKLNGTQLRDENAKKYKTWVASVTDEELISIIRGKQLD